MVRFGEMNMIYILDIIGTIVFAISGALASRERKLDVFGTVVIAFITAVGGGTIRDIIIGHQPVSWLNDSLYIYSIFFGILLTFIFNKTLLKLKKTLFLFDSIGISVFTILGIEKALSHEMNYGIAIMFGIISAVTGGILRDVICNDVPLILRKEIYASACLIGGVFFIVLSILNFNFELNLIITTLIITSIRILSIKFKWKLPI
jgi:uncharacterized membrane protein YeiH